MVNRNMNVYRTLITPGGGLPSNRWGEVVEWERRRDMHKTTTFFRVEGVDHSNAMDAVCWAMSRACTTGLEGLVC